MTWTLDTAAEYLRTKEASTSFLDAIGRIERTLTFGQERVNRVARFLEIARAYAAGVAVAEIEKQHDCSRHTVLRYARLAGLPKRPKDFGEATRLSALALYREGRPIAEIAEKLGVSQAYVSKLATAEGINRRDFSGSRGEKAQKGRD